MTGKIRRTRKPHEGKVPDITALTDPELTFSFKFIDLGHPDFPLTACQEGYLQKFLERLQALNHMTVGVFRTSRSGSIRAHRITWDKTSQRDGFRNLPEQLREEEAWQFEVTRNEHGRVHGILLDNTFFIVWLDPGHKLYPGNRRK